MSFRVKSAKDPEQQGFLRTPYIIKRRKRYDNAALWFDAYI